jgi:hypothetical protein
MTAFEKRASQIGAKFTTRAEHTPSWAKVGYGARRAIDGEHPNGEDGSKPDLVGCHARPRGGQENRCGEPPRRRVGELWPHHESCEIPMPALGRRPACAARSAPPFVQPPGLPAVAAAKRAAETSWVIIWSEAPLFPMGALGSG